VLRYIGEVVEDKQAFELLLSPSDKELVFGTKSGKREVLRKLHDTLGSLIAELKTTAGEKLDAEIRYAGEVPAHAHSE
jgi:hypothetical protein